MLLFTLVLLFILLELFELSWQWKNTNTFYGLLQNNLNLFNKNIFIYFIFHTTFFYTIFLSFFYHNFTFLMNSILVIKFIDIAFKITILSKLNKGESLNELFPYDMTLAPIFRYYSLFLYPSLFLYSFYN